METSGVLGAGHDDQEWSLQVVPHGGQYERPGGLQSLHLLERLPRPHTFQEALVGRMTAYKLEKSGEAHEAILTERLMP